MSEKKNAKHRGDWNGLLHIFSLCRVTIQQTVSGHRVQGHAAGGHDTASNPATQPHDTAHDTTGPRVRACGCVSIQTIVS